MKKETEEYQIGDIIKNGKQTFLVIKVLKDKYKLREVFMEPKNKKFPKRQGMKMGDFFIADKIK